MALTTLIPNDNPMYTSSNWLIHHGSGNFYSILSDSTDDTYIHSMGGSNPIMYPITDVPGGFSFASSVTVNIRENNSGSPTDSFPVYLQIIDGADGTTPLTELNFFPDSSTISNYSVQLAVIGATDSGTWNNALLKITTGSSSNNRITNVYEVSIDLTYDVIVNDEYGSAGIIADGTINDFQYTSNPIIGLTGSLGNGLASRGLIYLNDGSTDGPLLNGINRAYVNGEAINPVTYDIIASAAGVKGNSSSTQIIKAIFKPDISIIGLVANGLAALRTRFGPSSTKDGPRASGSAIISDNRTRTTTGVGTRASGLALNSINRTQSISSSGVIANGLAKISEIRTVTTTGSGVALGGTAIVYTTFVIIGSSGARANGFNINLYKAGYPISGGCRGSGAYILQQTYASQPLQGGVRIFGEAVPDQIKPINTQPHRGYALVMKTPNILNSAKPNPNTLINRDSKSPRLPDNRFEIKHQIGYCSFGGSCKSKDPYLPEIIKNRQEPYLPSPEGSTVISNDQIATATGI